MMVSHHLVELTLDAASRSLCLIVKFLAVEISEVRGIMPIRPDADQNKIMLGLKRAIEATFDDGKWRELGYMTGTISRIEGHRRLLRSLNWGDTDYGGCIFDVLPAVVGSSMENLTIVESYVGLEAWLRANDTDLHAELYGGPDLVPLTHVEESASVLDVVELNRQAARIRNSINEDPALAIGSAKELLETVLKTLIGIHESRSDENIHELLKRAQRELDLDPRSVSGELPGADIIRRTLSNLGQIVVGVAEVRSLYGTGHGRSRTPELEKAHARLVVNAAVSVATFLLEVWRARGSSRSV